MYTKRKEVNSIRAEDGHGTVFIPSDGVTRDMRGE